MTQYEGGKTSNYIPPFKIMLFGIMLFQTLHSLLRRKVKPVYFIALRNSTAFICHCNDPVNIMCHVEKSW